MAAGTDLSSYPILLTETLSSSQQEQIRLLTSACQDHDGIRLSYLLEDEGPVLHCLMFTPRGQLISVLGLIQLGNDLAECAAFTSPDHRRQGCFSHLLEHVLGENGRTDSLSPCWKDLEQWDLLFPADESCGDTMAVLQAIGAELDHREYRMELDLDASDAPSEPTHVCRSDSLALLCPSGLWEGTARWELTGLPSRGPIGSCFTSPVFPGCLCLHQVEICPERRNQGYGTRFICLLLDQLRRQPDPPRKVLLHVSGDNLPALSLYKKAGFRVTETLAFYLY